MNRISAPALRKASPRRSASLSPCVALLSVRAAIKNSSEVLLCTAAEILIVASSISTTSLFSI